MFWELWCCIISELVLNPSCIIFKNLADIWICILNEWVNRAQFVCLYAHSFRICIHAPCQDTDPRKCWHTGVNYESSKEKEICRFIRVYLKNHMRIHWYALHTYLTFSPASISTNSTFWEKTWNISIASFHFSSIQHSSS